MNDQLALLLSLPAEAEDLLHIPQLDDACTRLSQPEFQRLVSDSLHSTRAPRASFWVGSRPTPNHSRVTGNSRDGPLVYPRMGGDFSRRLRNGATAVWEWVGPPPLTDSEQLRVATLLSCFQAFTLAGTIAVGAIVLTAQPFPLRGLVLSLFAGVMALSLLSWGLMRASRLVSSSWSLIGSVWLVAAIAVVGQGLESPSVLTFALVITAIGLLIGTQAVLLSTLLTVLFLGAVYGLESRGLIAPAEPSLLYRWLLTSVVTLYLGILLGVGAWTYGASRQRLLASERRWKTLVDALPDGVVSLSADRVIEEVNPELERITGLDASELIGREALDPQLTDPEWVPALEDVLERVLGGEPQPLIRSEVRRPDGSRRRLEVQARRVQQEDGSTGALAVVRDVEERETQAERETELEHQLREAQRLEAIGRLAGGVAHDFNNALAVIVAHADLMLPSSLQQGTQANVRGILRAADHASGLTRQLLAFGRRQVLETRRLDLREILREIEPLLRRLLGETVSLTLELPSHPIVVRADPTQIGQVVINLAANARDAMPHGGVLRVELQAVEASPGAEPAFLETDSYARLTLTDTGIGFDAETQAHLFEPFYSTKGEAGTGLGLATVHGIVKQSDGHIVARSQPGEGSSFDVYLPLSADSAVPPTRPQCESDAQRRQATILVAEDELALRQLVAMMLQRIGHRVLVAESTEDALRIGREYDGPIDLLLTDMIMPGLSGTQLADRLSDLRSGLRVLFMSGYTDDEIRRRGGPREDMHLIAKPFRLEELSQKVHEVLRAGATC